ncbi:TRAP transporter small permease [Mangrovicoccus algicola]|uniref:TRAP transporter small permease protein n=1 Tax=Mangrovicoccus algicola TaxID=2771008 RepID=A0A8J7CYP2_9RHOB|nr:TRAP transporter small permease [Mangrovicoccus algicola]MBE3636778.1 TRAP transporter small permease [Mangrovicoccus algicola]
MRFWKIYDGVETVLTLAALAGVVIAVLASGIGRSIGAPLAAAPQYAQLCLIWTIMLGADIATRSGEHIRVSALSDALSPRGRAALSLLCAAIILPFLIFMAWHGWHLALGNWQRELGASGLSYGLVTLALPVGAALLAISFLRRLAAAGPSKLLEPDIARVEDATTSEELL